MHSSPTQHDLSLYRFADELLVPKARARETANPNNCVLGMFVNYSWQSAAFHYLFGQARDARLKLKQILADARDYYFGNWRLTLHVDPVPESDAFRPLPDEHAARDYTWNPTEFKESLTAALVLCDRAMSTKLAKYLLAERVPAMTAEVGIEFTDDAIDIYETYADLILGKPPRVTRATPPRKKLPHKRIQLMRECVFAATDGDAARCLDALQAFVKYFRTREIEKGEAYTAWLSTDATISYHLMTRRLGKPLELTRDDLYHVMVLKGK